MMVMKEAIGMGLRWTTMDDGGIHIERHKKILQNLQLFDQCVYWHESP